MSEVLIAGRPVGDGHPCFIVAEIGINHNGSISIAKKLHRQAATQSSSRSVRSMWSTLRQSSL